MKPILILIFLCIVYNLFAQKTSKKTGINQIYKFDNYAVSKDSLSGKEFHFDELYNKEFHFPQRTNENKFYIIPKGNFTLKIIKPDSTMKYSGRVITGDW